MNQTPKRRTTLRLRINVFAISVLMAFASPFMTAAAPYFYTGVAVTAALAVFEDQISDPLQREAIEDRPLGAFATKLGELAGDMIPNVLYVLGMLGYGIAKRDKKAKDRASVMWTSSFYSVVMCNALKLIFLEPRPDGSDHFSFPSGHSASAFSFASAIGVNHHWAFALPAYGYAALVAYSRMNDNRHYLHDVIAGATLGLAYGIAAYDVQKRQRQQSIT